MNGIQWTSDDVDRHLYENAELLGLIHTPHIPTDERFVFIRRLRANVLALSEIAGIELELHPGHFPERERERVRRDPRDLDDDVPLMQAARRPPPPLQAEPRNRAPPPARPLPVTREPLPHERDEPMPTPEVVRSRPSTAAGHRPPASGGRGRHVVDGPSGKPWEEEPAEVRVQVECTKGNTLKGTLVLTKKDQPRSGQLTYNQEIRCTCCNEPFGSRTNWLKHNNDKTGRVLENIIVPKTGQNLRDFAHSGEPEAVYVLAAMNFKEVTVKVPGLEDPLGP